MVLALATRGLIVYVKYHLVHTISIDKLYLVISVIRTFRRLGKFLFPFVLLRGPVTHLNFGTARTPDQRKKRGTASINRTNIKISKY